MLEYNKNIAVKTMMKRKHEKVHMIVKLQLSMNRLIKRDYPWFIQSREVRGQGGGEGWSLALDVGQVVLPADAGQLDPRRVLEPASGYQHDVVLLGKERKKERV